MANGKLSNVVVNISTATTTALKAADSTAKWKVVGGHLKMNGTVDLTWKSGSTNLTGATRYLSGDGVTFTPAVLSGGSLFPHFITAQGEALNLLTGQAIQVSGNLIVEKVVANPSQT